MEVRQYDDGPTRGPEPDELGQFGRVGRRMIEVRARSGLSAFEAIERQLGLNLEQQQRSIPVTVIDHVEAKPTER